jgi:hypothetical protein
MQHTNNKELNWIIIIISSSSSKLPVNNDRKILSSNEYYPIRSKITEQHYHGNGYNNTLS